MIDFNKARGTRSKALETDPVKIYDDLDRKTTAGPLRPAQDTVLKEWFSKHRSEKDLVVKLDTGSGKTLIGLLVLQSILNQTKKPCLYVCPNKYLANQVRIDADKFGIPHCEINENNKIPVSYLGGQKILITHAQKVFNGKSVFKLDNNSVHCGAIVLDDAHACAEVVKSAFSIVVNRKEDLYHQFLSLFEDDLKKQGHGTFLELKSAENGAHLQIPYWAWNSKMDKAAELLSGAAKSNNSVFFPWPLIKNNLSNLQANISSSQIELTPYYLPIERFKFFSEADHRILMSATTQDDSFFVKGLDFSVQAVAKPLKDPTKKWSGEKMILIPSMIDSRLDQDTVFNNATRFTKDKYGMAILVPSYAKAEPYEILGSLISKTETIEDDISKLREKDFSKSVLFANRYDGIDLPDESCRILIIDSKPFFLSLSSQYEESCRPSSDIVNLRLAQRVEQALGRSVRGEKDYSVIIISGDDLIDFLRNTQTRKYFSPQTQKQIEIGLEIARIARENAETDDPVRTLETLFKQAIESRDKGWKSFYEDEMSEIEDEQVDVDIYEIARLERSVGKKCYYEHYEEAVEELQQLIDNFFSLKSADKGWYLQEMARILDFYRKSESQARQLAAFKSNFQLLKPIEGVNYKKLTYIDAKRTGLIKKWIANFSASDDMVLRVNGLLAHLNFGEPFEKFENALFELGMAIGFKSERPDKEYKEGPDVLWCGSNNHYVFFECKNEVLATRDFISKSEASQMNTHCAWFEKKYGDVNVDRYLITQIHKLSYGAHFTHANKIIRKHELKKLSKAISGFYRELGNYEIGTIDDDTIARLLNTHEIDMIDIREKYSKDPFIKQQRNE